MTRKLLTLFIVSMVPVVELRGAIPMGILWEIPFWLNYLICVLGNILPVPFLILFAGKALRWLTRFPVVGPICQKIIDRGNRKAGQLGKYELLGLYLFVAVPMPGTGAWTGCLIATLLQMKLSRCAPAIALGVMTSGIIMGIATFGVAGLFSFL